MKKIIALALIAVVLSFVLSDKPVFSSNNQDDISITFCTDYIYNDVTVRECTDEPPGRGTCKENCTFTNGKLRCVMNCTVYIDDTFGSPIPPPDPFVSPIAPPVEPEAPVYSVAAPQVTHTWTDTGDLWMGEYQMLVNEQGEYCIPQLKSCH